MKRLVIESPYKAYDGYTIEENVLFCEKVCRQACLQGYAPLASHLIYTRFLDDGDPFERKLGFDSGLVWARQAEEVWFCLRPGELFTGGMKYAAQGYISRGIPFQVRVFASGGSYLFTWDEAHLQQYIDEEVLNNGQSRQVDSDTREARSHG